MVGILAFVAALALARMDRSATATPGEIAAAHAHADDVIARAGAKADFENITDAAIPTVRHSASGMTCTFTTGDRRDNIRYYGGAANGPPHGDDVSCGGWVNTTFLNLFATRYPERPSREAVFQSAMADVPRNTPGAEFVEGEFDTVSIDGRPAPLIGVSSMTLGGQPKQSYVMADQVGDWTFQARGTGPLEDTTVNLITAMNFALSLPGAREKARRQPD
jgi:hypothetical protein